MRSLSILCLFWVAACAGGGADLEREVVRLRQEMYALRSDLDRSERQYAALREDVERLQRRPVPEAKPSAAPSSEVSPPPALPVVRVSPEGRAVEVEPEPAGAVDDGSPPILIKMGPGASDRLEVDRDVLQKPDPVLHRSVPEAQTPAVHRKSFPPKVQYEVALATLREQRDPGRAVELFTAFEKQHPGSALADNAAYWTGEAQFLLGEYAQCLQTFTRVMQAYPQSNKVPWALLRGGQALQALGRGGQARARLESVLDRFPESEAAKEARAKLDAWMARERKM